MLKLVILIQAKDKACNMKVTNLHALPGDSDGKESAYNA